MNTTTTSQPDVLISRHGYSITLFEPVSEAARSWIADNVYDDPDEPAIWFAGALVVDARLALDLALAMAEDGLSYAHTEGT